MSDPGSGALRALAQGDPQLAVWWGTRTECVSAVERRTRIGGLDPTQRAAVLAQLAQLRSGWNEVSPSGRLRDEAERLLGLHPLSAADAFQLAAALDWSGRGARDGFVCLDERLRTAAKREGFTLLP